MKYTEIKSNYIKNKLKQTKYKDREYIDTLIKIEGLALGKSYGMTTGYMWKNLPKNYPKEWKKIWKEINPKKYIEMLEHEERERTAELREEIVRKHMELEEEQQRRNNWIAAGGK